jgi:hypothetical protein
VKRVMPILVGLLLALTPTAAEAKKYPPSSSHTIQCVDDYHSAKLIWKLDGQRIVKIAIRNDCDHDVTMRWDGNGGKYYVLEVGPQTSIDLWKGELKPFGKTIKKVTWMHFDADGVQEDRWYCKVFVAQPDGTVKMTHDSGRPEPDCETPASCGGC